MNTNTAAYWIAVGVLALGLNSEYQHGHFVALHRVAEHAGSVLCQVSARAEAAVVAVTGLTDRRATVPEHEFAAADQADMVRAQSEITREEARAQAELVREQVRQQILAQIDAMRAQVDVRRAEMEQLRWRVRSDLRLANASGRRVAVICPKTGTRIMVSAGPELSEDAADVDVSDTF